MSDERLAHGGEGHGDCLYLARKNCRSKIDPGTGRCDVRLGTAPARVQWRPASGNSSQPSAPAASQPSDGADAPAADCQFEIVHAKARLVAMFHDVDRPSVKKILPLDVF